MLRRRWTVVGDQVIHSRETAGAWDPEARPIVLVHGVGTTSHYYRPLLEALAGRVPAVAVELPGIGGSSSDRIPTDVAGQADVVAAWLRATAIRPAAVVGNSMGAQTVVELARRHPELASRPVLIGPTVDADARSLPRQLGRLLLDAPLERRSMLAIAVADAFRTRRRAVLRYARASLDHRIEERIGGVTVPIVVVRGERDPIAPRRWVQQLVDAAPSASMHEIADGAHACHHGEPEAVAALLVDLVACPDAGGLSER